MSEPVLPKHKCRVCGVESQSFGHDDLCSQHFVEWLTTDDYAAIMTPSPQPHPPHAHWTVMVDAWLERRSQTQGASRRVAPWPTSTDSIAESFASPPN